MSAVLDSILESWGMNVPAVPVADLAKEESRNLTEVPKSDAMPEPKSEGVPYFSNEWFGLAVVGQESVDVETDMERLKELMRLYPIRPHLHEAGGSGFSMCYATDWHPDKDSIVREFSRLWFTAAGDRIIAEYGHLMHVIPHADRMEPVRFRLWKTSETGDPRLSTVSGGNADLSTF